MKLNKAFPVFANTPPWNALILLGVRKFKTLGFDWKYRGTVYLYDSKRSNPETMEYGFDYGLDRGVPKRRVQNLIAPGFIVGTVDIIRNRSWDECEEGEHEIELANPVRFKKPTPFSWPKGAIRIARIK